MTTSYPICDVRDCPGFGTAHPPLEPERGGLLGILDMLRDPAGRVELVGRIAHWRPGKRSTSFDTVGIFQATKVAAGPVRVVLLRTFSPEGDPYERMIHPSGGTRPYYDGSVRYSVVLFLGARLRFQVEIGER